MAQKREGRVVIRALPWRKGLLTAGQQTTIEEDAMWEAQDTTAELDGMLSKRPGLRKWAQTIKEPDKDAAVSTFTHFEGWSTFSNWTESDSSVGLITDSIEFGTVRTNIAGGSSNETLSRSLQGTSATGEISVRFMLRIVGAPVYTASATVANTLSIRVGDTTGKEFAFHDDGVYYKLNSDNTYSLIADSADATNGGWHAVELRIGATDTNLYIDDALITTAAITTSDIKGVALTNSAALMEFRWEVEGGGALQYSTDLGSVMINDAVDHVVAEVETVPFVAQEIRAITDFRFLNKAGSTQRVLLAAAGGFLYHDSGLQGGWRVLIPLQETNTFFAPFRRTILIVDYSSNTNSVLHQWNGLDEVEVLDDAPRLTHVTEHKQRVWGAGDSENPLRLYHSGDRQPNLWFSPDSGNIEDQLDALEQAGYLEVPSKKGDAIVGIFGDYYGRLYVFTRRGVWQVAGAGPASFTMEAVTQDVGAENGNCITQVGNDLWFMGRGGIHSLSTVQQYGDVAASFPSAPISDLWSQSPSATIKVVRDYLHRGSLKYNPTQGLVYAAVPTTGDTTPNSVYVYNVNNKQWYGPWRIDSRAMENIEIAPPEVEVMAHGGVDGNFLFTDQGSRQDVDAEINMRIQSAALNGRSIDPVLPGYVKTWKTLRLYVLPRGDWDMTIRWHTDSEAEQTTTKNQNVHKSQVMGDQAGDGSGDFRVDTDRILSRETMGVIEVPLNARGRSLRFIIEQDGVGQDLVIQGFDVEFMAHGYEASN